MFHFQYAKLIVAWQKEII